MTILLFASFDFVDVEFKIVILSVGIKCPFLLSNIIACLVSNVISISF